MTKAGPEMRLSLTGAAGLVQRGQVAQHKIEPRLYGTEVEELPESWFGIATFVIRLSCDCVTWQATVQAPSPV